MKHFLNSFFISLLMTGISCHQTLLYAPKTPPPLSWEFLTKNVERKVIEQTINNKNYKVVAFRINPDNIKIKFHNNFKPLLLEEWGKNIDSTLLINGGYFNEQYQPTGLLIIDGQNISDHTYDLNRSGLLLVEDKKVSIVDTAVKSLPKISEKTSILQSFPLLIKPGGKPGIEEDTKKLARRTIIAKTTDDKILLIIVDQTPISLFTLMELLLNSDLKIDAALNLDGGPSTGLIVNTKSFTESLISITPLPQVISFTETDTGTDSVSNETKQIMID